jgi:hypothetical protein
MRMARRVASAMVSAEFTLVFQFVTGRKSAS